MITAPHPHVSPTLAAGDPSINTLSLPVVIGVMPCIGQECRSPFRAAGIPLINVRDAPLMIVPPWLDESPNLAIEAAMELSPEICDYSADDPRYDAAKCDY